MIDFPSFEELPQNPDLPDVLAGVTNSAEWPARREQILAAAAHYLYGTMPQWPRRACCRILSRTSTLNGTAILEQAVVEYAENASFDAFILRPDRQERFPFVIWIGGDRCPYEKELIERGYALVGFNHQQLCEDGKHIADPPSVAHTAYPHASWGAIMRWGFGACKVIDCLEEMPFADTAKIIVTGHSRCGKAALAAGVYDERIAVCAPINSGCGGAGCCRFLGDAHSIHQNPNLTESVGRITDTFPHWFHPRFSRFGGTAPDFPLGNEQYLPFDQHFLKAAVAPRALITIEGEEDLWSNPYGTYLTYQAAQPVFDLLGASRRNRYVLREGGHCFGAADWKRVLDFADDIWNEA